MKYKRVITIVLLMWLLIIILQVNSNASSDIIVMLDPGHGEYDSGAVYGNLKEKDITWKIAKKVKEILDKTSGIKGILTREENTNPSLYERGKLATKNGADLLVSFHINSMPRENIASGAEVYVTGNTNSDRYYKASNNLALSILENFRGIGLKSFDTRSKIKLSTDGERYSDGFITDYYGIIRNPMYYGIPGVLVEHCFINNVNDRTNFLIDDSKIEAMAEQDAKAIIENKELFRTDKSNNSVNSEIKSISVNKSKTHITGEIVVVDWLYGMQSIPVDTPIINLVTTDGKEKINCYVSKKNGNTYYFDTWLSNIKNNKKYKLQVESQNVLSIPQNNKMTVNIGSNRTLYKSENCTYIIKNNAIQIEGEVQTEVEDNNKTYKGDVTSEIKEFNWNKKSNYFSGKVVVIEWIEGKSTVPTTLPTITIKSTDKKFIKKCYVKQINGNTYYFDACIKGIDISKKYNIEISSENPKNVSKNKKQKAYLKDMNSNTWEYQNAIIRIKNSKIMFRTDLYKGNINSELKGITLGTSNKNSYISGKIVIVEWVNGKSTVPTKTPKMRLKSTDGKVDLEMFVTPTGTNTYYFDRFIEGIDTTKKYKITIESSDEKNISVYRKARVYFSGKFSNKKLGKYRNTEIKLKNNKIVFKLLTKTEKTNKSTNSKQQNTGKK